MANFSKFGYDVSVEFISGNKIFPIKKEYIKSLVINREFMNKNMPTVYLTVIVETELYNEIATKQKDSTFSIKILKYDSLSTVPTKKNYVFEQLSYINKFDIIAQGVDGTDNLSEVKNLDLHKLVLGLYKKSIVNNNKKKIINGIIKNSNMISIIHNYTSHMKMVIDPFDNNANIPYLIVPPIESISDLLNYLNKILAFYKTPYLYFMDFDYTYLISTKGSFIDVKDNTYSRIKINILDNNPETGMIIDDDKEIYIIDIHSKNVDVNINKTMDNKINVLSGVSTDGNVSTASINVNKDSNSSSKQKYIKVYNNNQDYIAQLKKSAELTSTTLVITLNDIDTSLFTPNREYIIVNKSISKELDGSYFLSFRKELYTFDTRLAGNGFSCKTIIGLHKL